MMKTAKTFRRMLSLILVIASFATCLLGFASCGTQDDSDMPVLKQQATEFDLTVSVYGNGSVDKTGGTYKKGDSVTVTATADEGYQFKQWLDAKHNPLSTELAYTFVFGKADVGLIAEFEAIPTTDSTITVENNATIKDTDVEDEEEDSFYTDEIGAMVVQTVAQLENCPAELAIAVRSELPPAELAAAIELLDINGEAVPFNVTFIDAGIFEITAVGNFKPGYSYSLILSDGITFDGYVNTISTLNFNIELSQQVIEENTDDNGNFVVELDTIDGDGYEIVIETGRSTASVQDAGPIMVALMEDEDFRYTLSAAIVAAEQCSAKNGNGKKTMMDVEKNSDGSYTLNVTGDNFVLNATFLYKVDTEVNFTAQAKKQGNSRTYQKIQYNPIIITETYGLSLTAFVGNEQIDAKDFAKKINEVLYSDQNALNKTMNDIAIGFASALDTSENYVEIMSDVHAGTRNFDVIFTPSFSIEDFFLNGFGALSFESTVTSKVSYTLTNEETPYRDYTVSRTQSTRIGDNVAYVGSLSFKLNNSIAINQSGKNEVHMPNHANGNFDVKINTSLELCNVKGMLISNGISVGSLTLKHHENIQWRFAGRLERAYAQTSVIYDYAAPTASAILGYSNRVDTVEVSPNGVKLVDLRLFDVRVFNPKSGTYSILTLPDSDFNVTILKGADKIKYENGRLMLTDAMATNLSATISIECRLTSDEGRYVNLPPRILNVKFDKMFDIDAYLDAYYKTKDTETEASFRAIYRAASPETRDLVVAILKDVLNKIEIAEQYKDMSNAIIEQYFTLLYDLVDEYKQNTDTYERQWENEFVKEARTFDTLISFTNLVIASKGNFDEKTAKELARSVLESRLMKGAAEYMIENDTETKLWTKLKEKYAASSDAVKATVNAEIAQFRADATEAELETALLVERLLGIID